MHDSFNLAWKLNLVIRGLGKPSLLHTYEEERRKIAYDLIQFDVEHCKAFSEGETALVKNFDDNIRFISGIGAEYSPGVLTRSCSSVSGLLPGMLQLPARVTRYIDANPVDIQLDIPLLGQFKIYIFVPDVCSSKNALGHLCQLLKTSLTRITLLANWSYEEHARRHSLSDDFHQLQRYTAVSEAFTFALITQSSRSEFEISQLPDMLQKSRWSLYLDNCQIPSCTTKWFGELGTERIGVAIVRPDGYIGGIDKWEFAQADIEWKCFEDHFSFMVC
jgi:phenol 2-monooxygenase